MAKFEVVSKAYGKSERVIYSGESLEEAKEAVSSQKGSVERVQTKVDGAWTFEKSLYFDDYDQYRKDMAASKFDAGFERDEKNR